MKLLQVDIKGETVADLGPPVPEDTPPCGPGTIAITILRPAPRPSLEVETEVHMHLSPRIEAHLRRIEGWDKRTMSPALQDVFRAVLDNIRRGFDALGEELASLAGTGFVAKTTTTSRKRVALKCAIGKPVKLRPDIHAATVGLFYSEEELAALTLSQVGESSVLLRTKEGREIGPLRFSHVEVVE